jgi:hypothetical protein
LNGLLSIEIKGITLNVGPPAQLPATSGPPDDGGSPSKKMPLSNSHLSSLYPFDKFVISAIIFSDVRFLYTLLSYKIIKKSLTHRTKNLLSFGKNLNTAMENK